MSETARTSRPDKKGGKLKAVILTGLAVLAIVAIWRFMTTRPPQWEALAPVASLSAISTAEARQSAAHYSTLDQINAANVHRLEIAWTHHTGDLDDAEGALIAFEDQPLLIEENLIICTPSRQVIALDPATGERRWIFDPKSTADKMLKCRGVSSWTDGAAPGDQVCRTRLIWATADNRLIAIDAKTGVACAGFGNNGTVQVTAEKPELFPGELSLSSTPAIVNDVIVVGSAVADNQRADGPSGKVRAFDARTGAMRWEFDPLPRDPSNPAAASWDNGSAGDIGGANVWSSMSVDAARDLVFLPTTSPSADFYGGGRPGDNLYANSVVALRGATGEVVWHYQLTHHDVWDYDIPTAPILIEDYPGENGPAPAVVVLTKTGMVFVFHRETGEPLSAVEERAVPQTPVVAGEKLSPTQPFSVDMPLLVKHGFTKDDVWGFTPFDKGSCRKKLDELYHGDIYTPPSERGTIYMPGAAGGANWGGGAYDPNSGVLVVPTARVPLVMTLVPREGADLSALEGGAIETRGAMVFPHEATPYLAHMEPFMSSFGAPCSKPPWAGLTAVDLINKEILWDVPLGSIDKLSGAPFPIKLGTPGAGGPLLTAGGVVFIGYTLDNRLRAHDVRTGKAIWKSPLLPAPVNASPITYERDGVQYVIAPAGGHSMYGTDRSDAVIAFRLKN